MKKFLYSKHRLQIHYENKELTSIKTNFMQKGWIQDYGYSARLFHEGKGNRNRNRGLVCLL